MGLVATMTGGSSIWGFLAEIFREQGVLAVVLIVGCFIFWKLIWRVWDRAMRAKDEEIERLVKQRDKYQSLVFDRLLSSKAMDAETEGSDHDPKE